MFWSRAQVDTADLAASISGNITWADQPGNDGKDVAIFVLGLTGAGKSTFINVLLREWVMRVGRGLTACTFAPDFAEIHSPSLLSRFPESRNRRLLVVDMPGFDADPNRDDFVFTTLLRWAKDKNVVVGGFIYLLDITLSRFQGHERYLSYLERLCGSGQLRNKLVFGTTHWDQPIDENDLRSVETEIGILLGQNDLLPRDSKPLRFLKTTETAWQIVETILRQTFPSNQIIPQVRIRKTKQPKKEIVIPVMGATGAGKSSFINKLIGEDVMEVSKGTNSCTQDLQIAYVDGLPSRGHEHLSNYRLVLVDTPGFDDTHVADVETLERIAKWLEKSYRDGKIIGGVIYLQDITPTRMTGTARRNLQILRGICGSRALDRVAVLTTMWGKIRDEYKQEAEAREEELKTKHFTSMIEKGARVFRFNHDSSSAWFAVNVLLNSLFLDDTVTTILRIQEELAKENKFIPETEAGQALRCTLKEVLEFQQKYSDILGHLPQDEQVKRDLQEALVRINRLTTQLEQLKIPISRRLRNILRELLKKFSFKFAFH